MSEREYVEKIMGAARAYQEAIADGRLNVHSIEHATWAGLKASLSPSTAIALCEAWLALAREERSE